MVEVNPSRLKEIVAAGEGKRILVVGDLMLDRHLRGKVSRISPEAPVPIISIEDEEIRFGGAANVANNLIALKAIPILVGAVGLDNWGDIFRKMLQQKELPAKGLLADSTRPTTLKTRVIGNNQHIARIDSEKVHVISEKLEAEMLQFISTVIADVDGVILQDYNKGVLTPRLVEAVIRLANKHGKIITVDPKFDNFLAYRHTTVFKPNRKEAEEALGIRLDSAEAIRSAGRRLLEKLDAEAILITLSEKGMALFEKDGGLTIEATRARKVADVSGAGDTVIATLTFAMAAGASLKEAVALANHAAGVVCGDVGVVPIEIPDLVHAIRKAQEPPL